MWLLIVAAAFIAIAFCIFTFQVLPNLNQYRQALEQQLSQVLSRKVNIGRLSGNWDGVAPRFVLSHISIADPSGGAALTLSQVEVVPSWSSLTAFEPRMALIAIQAPALEVSRQHDGHFYLNGIALAGHPQKNQENPANWLLRQKRIVINNAHIIWQDQYLKLPRIELVQGQLELTSGLFGHDIEVSGRPTTAVGQFFDLAASWRGNDLDQWSQWNGRVTANLQGARVSAWSRYLQSFGLLRTGEGDGSISMAFAGGRINSLEADVKVKNAAYALPGARELALPAINGHLRIERTGQRYQIKASHLSLQTTNGLLFQDANIQGYWNPAPDGGGDVEVDNVNLSALAPFLHALGVDNNPLFASFSPKGQLEKLAVSWQGALEAPSGYRVSTQFKNLAWQPFGKVPGVKGVSGSVKFDPTGGQLTLDSASQVRMPDVFAAPLSFSRMNARFDWKINGQVVQVDQQLKFANDDLTGWLKGRYQHRAPGSDGLDLSGGIDKIAANRVADYVPFQAGAGTIKWLRAALGAGYYQNLNFSLKGDLARFPFKSGQGGLFQIDSDFAGVNLKFEPTWPTLEGLNGHVQFKNEKMSISTFRLTTLGVPLTQVSASIADLSVPHPVLKVVGQVNAPLAAMLRYTLKSPVDKLLSGLTRGIQAQGAGQLDLALNIPLSGSEPVGVDGQLHFQHNAVTLGALPLPPLEAVTGVLRFSGHGVEIPAIRFNALGGQFALKAATGKDERMRFALQGVADSRKLLSRYLSDLLPYVSGQTAYQARFVVRRGLESLQLSSDLQGVQLDLPASLGKKAAERMPLNLTLLPVSGAQAGYKLDFSLGSLIAGRQRLDSTGSALATQLAIGQNLGAMPTQGLDVKMALPVIDAKSWVDWGIQGVANSKTVIRPFRIQLTTPLLRWNDMALHNVHLWLGQNPQQASWHAMVDANEVKGEIDYDPKDSGWIHARLPLLMLNWPDSASHHFSAPDDFGSRPLPALDIRIRNLMLQGRSLGRLSLNARYSGQDWKLDGVKLQMPEGVVTGSMQVMGAKSSSAQVQVTTTDVGKMLERFGLKDTFKKGQGKLDGALSWPGGLLAFNTARLSGQMSVQLNDGQFAKVDSGVARLLGAISLQSLSRRIHLDFTDVFSNGFAFDTFKGDAVLNNGIFRSDNFVMNGPGADVAIKGEVNLPEGSQQLQVHVEPHLSEGFAIATGAALINPVIGVAAYAAQKFLQDPVSKIFSVDYVISGKITSPVVSKAKLPVISNTIRKINR